MLNQEDNTGTPAPSAPGHGPGEGESYTKLDGSNENGLLILCDHAGNALPPDYGRLGLHESEFERHIAYDIGAAGVARRLAERLDVPAILTCYSRLLIDPNRGADDPTLIMSLSDGAIVPGNRDLSGDEIARRVRLYYEPYHAAIERAIDLGLAAGTIPVLFSVHSFTESWKGVLRPWHVTVLWDKDPRLPKPLLARLGQDPDLVVGENEPYSGELAGDCLNRHGTGRGLAHALVEIRQDLIRDETGQIAWADRLAGVLGDLMRDGELLASLRQIRHYTNAPKA